MNRYVQLKVWDPLIRGFHWTLVAAFIIAYFSHDQRMLQPHVWAGYLIIGLLLVRLAWGFIGTTYARFSDFVRAPDTVLGYMRDTFTGRARRYLGHNPAGGWMVIALLVMLALVSVTGLLLYGIDEHAGPLAGIRAAAGGEGGESLKVLHAFCTDFTVLLIMIHLAGVAAESLLHKANLMQAMVAGWKPVSAWPPSAKRGVKGPLTGALLVLMSGFALGLVGAMGHAKADSATVDIEEIKDLLPLEEVIAKAKAQHEGQLIEAELKKLDGIDVYEMEIVDEDGKVWEMYYNAKSGELMKEPEEKQK